VVCVTGDGAFGINAMEFDTAVPHGAKIVVIVSHNAAWNIQRLDQETNYGGRVVGRLLAHSDYAAMARAFGAPVSVWRSRRTFPALSSGRSPTPRLWSMW
jgi:acetolactate synthase-1/2/3 large subunit